MSNPKVRREEPRIGAFSSRRGADPIRNAIWRGARDSSGELPSTYAPVLEYSSGGALGEQAKLRLEISVQTRSQSLQGGHLVDNSCLLSDAFLLKAARFEAQAALDVISGDVSHEIAHTLNFLRCLCEEPAENPSFSPEDVTFARKEVERLERLLVHLRRLKLPPPVREPVQVFEVLRLAETEITGILMEKRISFSIEVAKNVTLLAEPHLLYLIIRGMLVHVVQHAASGSSVKVHMSLSDSDGEGLLEVWRRKDDAEPSPVSDPFDHWAAPLNEACEFGLSVAYRSARNLGWRLLTVKGEKQEGLRVSLPASAFPSRSIS